MTRKTSIETYNKIKQSGLLSRRRFDVYNTLYHDGPLTAMEVWQRLSKDMPGLTQHSVSPRTSELCEMGVIEEVGERKCGVTGSNAIIWATTDNLPVPIKKEKPSADLWLCSNCQKWGPMPDNWKCGCMTSFISYARELKT